MAPHARWTLPAAAGGINRTAYAFRGGSLRMDGEEIPAASAVRLRPDRELPLQNGAEESEMLLLQGRPIGEPVVQYGPFVMNSRAEIVQAFTDYQQTRFGNWPWPSDAPVHGGEAVHRARLPDGTVQQGG